jgi:DNA-binding FadR family transcriptional regulator
VVVEAAVFSHVEDVGEHERACTCIPKDQLVVYWRMVVERIRRGDFASRERRKLPSRREPIEQFGVSPQTADKAVRVLDDRGLVTRKQGMGVFAKSRDEWPPKQGTLEDLL